MENKQQREEVRTGNAILGKPRDANKMQTRQDPWAEAPFYAAGEQKSENITGLMEGDAICAVYHGLRRSKVGKKSNYLVLETEDGQKLRLFAPNQLAGSFVNRETGEARIPIGTYVEITYRGMKPHPEGGDDFHSFDVLVPKSTLN